MPSQPHPASESQGATAALRAPSPSSGFVQSLIDHRIPQIVGVYLAGAWTFFQFVQWLVNRYVLSPYLVDACLLLLLLLLPTAILLTLDNRSKAGNRFKKLQTVGVPCNVAGAALVLALVFWGKDLGSAQETVTVTDASGNEVERVVPKSAFRKRIALFAFENETGDPELDWLKGGFPLLLDADLEQDPFLVVRSPTNFAERIRQAGFEEPSGLPLALQREIAEEYRLDHLLTGSISQDDGGTYRLTTELRNTKTGRLKEKHTFEGGDLMALADEAAAELKQDLDIPKQHLEETVDLPAAEVTTSKLPAFQAYSHALDALIFEDDYAASAELLDEAVAEDPTFALAHLVRAQVLSAQQRQEEALEAMAAAQRHDYRLSEQDRFDLNARRLFLSKQPAEALRVAEQWSTLYPNDTEALGRLAWLYEVRGEPDEAIAALRKINELDPQAARHLKIGDLLLEEGRHEEALAAYQTYADLYPKKEVGYTHIGRARRAMGDFEEEQAAYQKALVVAPDDPEVLGRLGESLLRAGAFDQALGRLESALDRSRTPQERLGTLQKVIMYHALRGAYEDLFTTTEAFFDHLATLAPPTSVLLARAGFAPSYAEAGHMREAEAAIAAAEASPAYQSSDIYALNVELWRVLTRLEQDRTEGADEVLEEAEALIASYGLDEPILDYFRGLIYQHLGQHDQAVAAFRAFVEEGEGSPVFEDGWIQLGEVYHEQGKAQEAERHFREALRLYPSHPEAHLGLAKVLLEGGRTSEARRHLDRALEAWAVADDDHEEAGEAKALLAAL